MGVFGKPHNEYDESLMGQNKLHPEINNKRCRGAAPQLFEMRPADARIPRRAALPRDIPRRLAFDETSSSEDILYIYKYTIFFYETPDIEGGPEKLH